MALAPDMQKKIGDMVAENRVLLFMKGSRHFPQCGFSATVTQILDKLIPEYQTVNVLADPEIRSGIKEFSNWPTIPQLYVNGQFVGGCDIVREMYLSGELQSLLGVEEKIAAPTVTVTAAAAKAISAAREDGDVSTVRLEVSPGFEYALSMDDTQPGDFQVDAGHGITVLVDRDSAQRASGVRIDYSDSNGGGFKIENPNLPQH